MISIANCISFTRIILSLTLVFVKQSSIVFYIIYLICGVSDVLDGYIARKTNTISKLGEKLDSIADLLMVMVVIYVLYPVINPTVRIVVWIVIIGIIRVISMMVVLLKYKTFGILHTYGNKATGLVFFALPFLTAFSWFDVSLNIICMVASVSAIEELLIHLLSNRLQIDKKSIFTE